MVLGMVKKIILILIIVLLGGCVFPCKGRRFVAEDRWTYITDEWKVSFWMSSEDMCHKTDLFSCAAWISIEQKYLHEDSLKNVSYHIDSLYLEYAGQLFKRVNEEKEFVYAKKPIGEDPVNYYGDRFSISRTDSLKYIKWPSVPEDVDVVTATLYISFRNPDDGRIESKKITQKLYESFGVVFVTYDEWK